MPLLLNTQKKLFCLKLFRKCEYVPLPGREFAKLNKPLANQCIHEKRILQPLIYKQLFFYLNQAKNLKWFIAFVFGLTWAFDTKGLRILFTFFENWISLLLSIFSYADSKSLVNILWIHIHFKSLFSIHSNCKCTYLKY